MMLRSTTILLVALSALFPSPTLASPRRRETGGNNVCYLEQSGCKYRVTVLPTACSQQASDEPWREGPEEGERARPATALSGHAADVNATDGGDPETGAEASFKKLEALEQKLVKMMEELSVRSLRHIREIRTDLRLMSAQMNQFKGAAGKKSYGATGPGDTAALARCPSEFVGVGTWRACYRFSNFEATWHEAKEYCSAFGATLLTLETMKEAYVIDYLIKSNAEFEEPKGWWTSGQYVARSQRWAWQLDRQQSKPLDFNRWAPGEPNARSTMHCMILYKEARYYWHDATCSDKHSFICEMDN